MLLEVKTVVTCGGVVPGKGRGLLPGARKALILDLGIGNMFTLCECLELYPHDSGCLV